MFEPRPIRYHAVRAHAGWRLKTCSIVYGGGEPSWPEFEPGIRRALADLPGPPAAAPGRPGAGILIAHAGRTARYLVLGWWDNDNELPLRLFVQPPAGRRAWRRARGGEPVCVWDLQVLAFEREAYVATVLSGAPAGEAVESYLARVPPPSPAPVVLEGDHVRLEPLGWRHLDGLCAAGLEPEIWRVTGTRVETPEEMRAYVAAALQAQQRGAALRFAIVDRATGRVAGNTRIAAIDDAHRRVEIGWTWLGREWRRTALNTGAKLLLPGHAFGAWGCRRVELKTDALNDRSRRAILRIGAREEGTLRRQMSAPGGRVRDTVYYSVIAEEWPAVEARLRERLLRG